MIVLCSSSDLLALCLCPKIVFPSMVLLSPRSINNEFLSRRILFLIYCKDCKRIRPVKQVSDIAEGFTNLKFQRPELPDSSTTGSPPKWLLFTTLYHRCAASLAQPSTISAMSTAYPSLVTRKSQPCQTLRSDRELLSSSADCAKMYDFKSRQNSMRRFVGTIGLQKWQGLILTVSNSSWQCWTDTVSFPHRHV